VIAIWVALFLGRSSAVTLYHPSKTPRSQEPAAAFRRSTRGFGSEGTDAGPRLLPGGPARSRRAGPPGHAARLAGHREGRTDGFRPRRRPLVVVLRRRRDVR